MGIVQIRARRSGYTLMWLTTVRASLLMFGQVAMPGMRLEAAGRIMAMLELEDIETVVGLTHVQREVRNVHGEVVGHRQVVTGVYFRLIAAHPSWDEFRKLG